jgi:hypothetical protein
MKFQRVELARLPALRLFAARRLRGRLHLLAG